MWETFELNLSNASNRLQIVPFWIVEVARNSRKNWSERAEGGLGEIISPRSSLAAL